MDPYKITVIAGDLFCDREKETKYLVDNMLSGMHTMVFAPRHYGKSSLARIVLSRLEEKMVGIYVDLFSVNSHEDVALKLYRRTFEALGRGAVDKAALLFQLAEFFKNREGLDIV